MPKWVMVGATVMRTVGGIIEATREALPPGPPAGGRGRLPDPPAPRGRAVAGADLGMVVLYNTINRYINITQYRII